MKWHDARIKHLEEKFNSLFCKVFGLNQRRLFIIKRLWIDSMENRDAYGYEEIGFVQTNDEADRICGLEYVPKSKYPWPLDYAYEFKGDNVPRFIATEITDISGMGIDQLKALYQKEKERKIKWKEARLIHRTFE